MNPIKKMMGVVWIVLAALAVFLMVRQAGTEISEAVAKNKAVLDTQMFWYIIIPIFTPIMVGLGLFGWYALKGEYDTIDR